MHLLPRGSTQHWLLYQISAACQEKIAKDAKNLEAALQRRRAAPLLGRG
jgi:hypothetical protein